MLLTRHDPAAGTLLSGTKSSPPGFKTTLRLTRPNVLSCSCRSNQVANPWKIASVAAIPKSPLHLGIPPLLASRPRLQAHPHTRARPRPILFVTVVPPTLLWPSCTAPSGDTLLVSHQDPRVGVAPALDRGHLITAHLHTRVRLDQLCRRMPHVRHQSRRARSQVSPQQLPHQLQLDPTHLMTRTRRSRALIANLIRITHTTCNMDKKLCTLRVGEDIETPRPSSYNTIASLH